MDMEREYNCRAKVPEYPAILEGWGREAAAFRDSSVCAELEIAYGPSPRQVMDIFWPDVSRAAPLALFIHGGYWQALDNSWFSHLAAGLVAHGVAVALPSYDLCPAVSLATLTDQLREAAAFLYRRHHRRILATGHSAGGHLTAMLMATDWPARDAALPPDLVPAGLPISGLFDLEPLVETSINKAVGLDRTEARRLSPLRLPGRGGKLHAIAGGLEGPEFERQARSLAEAWGGSWESVPGAHHFNVIAPLADPTSALVRQALQLVPR
jgi:arylformamidase